MKRFAIFAILGPCLAGATLLLLVLPLATLLEGARIEMSLPAGQTLGLYLICIFPALVIGLFDWFAGMIEVPYRPVGVAIVGWILAAIVLRGWLALPDLPGWFLAVGMIGAVPAFVCSWVTLKVNQRQASNRTLAPKNGPF
jgi:hypothetical protein